MSVFDNINLEELHNEAERLVIEELERQLEKAPGGVCRTPECILDMAAFALNLVRPMYRATLLGRVYAATLDAGDEKKIRDAVRQAIKKISENPPG